MWWFLLCMNAGVCHGLLVLEWGQDMVWSGPNILVSAVENVVRTQDGDCRNIFFEFFQLYIFCAEMMQIMYPLPFFIINVSSVCPHLEWCNCYLVCLYICYKVWVWFSFQSVGCVQSGLSRNSQLKNMNWLRLLVYNNYRVFNNEGPKLCAYISG